MSVYSKKYHLFLSVILILSFGPQAEAQLWGGLKNALKKKAEEVITKEIEKSGKGEDEGKKEEKKKKVKQAAAKKVTKATPEKNNSTSETTASRPIGRPVVKAANGKGTNSAKTTKNLYPMEFPPMKFPIPTDDLYEQYEAEGKNPTARFPRCFSIMVWAGKSYNLHKNIRGNNFFPRGSLRHGRRSGLRSGGTYLMAGFKDENFVPVFGKRFGQWTDQDVKDFKSVAVRCRQKYMDELYMEGINVNSTYYYKMPGEKSLGEYRWQEDLATNIVMSSKARKVIRRHYPAKEKFYRDAKYFLDTDLIGYSKYVNGTVQTDSDALRNSDSYDTAMAHQRKVYPEYRAALALIDAQKAEAKAMPATKENIGKLVAMINDPQFAYLWPDEKKNHKNFLDNRVVALADQIIGIVIADFNDFPETMEGLKGLKTLYSQTFSDLQNLKSHKWNDLNQAYKARATAIAARVLEDAIAEIDSMSETIEGLQELQEFYTQKVRDFQGMKKGSAWEKFSQAYKERHTAIIAQIADNAIIHLDSFTNDLDGLRKLFAYWMEVQNNVSLSRAAQWNQSNHWMSFEQAYKRRENDIKTQIAYDAIDNLNSFTDDMDGLMKLMAYHTEIQNTVGRMAQWRDFERAYVTVFNEKAEDAVPDFEDKMSQLPASTANLRLIQSAVGDIFTTRPMPANLQAYRQVVTEQVQRVQKEIKKIACYKKLDKLDLDEDDRDAAILGYNGETTLGMFICGMKKRGYKFQEFDSAGLFSSTSTLSILSQRGITLSIDMEEVEAVKGREMLVGVLVKDVTSEKELTLTEWQDYAGRLAGR